MSDSGSPEFPADEPYLTLADDGECSFEVRGSEFLGHATHAPDIDAAESFVTSVREAYDDATHNVPCSRVRDEDGVLRERSDDDGEPTGSAGKPALNVLQQRELENVVAVVTRYYGGTNLGVGGLARAYSRAVREAVDDAGVVERRPSVRIAVTVDYDDSGTVRSILESEGSGGSDGSGESDGGGESDGSGGTERVAFEADYRERVTFDVRVARADAPALRDRIRSATSGRAEFG